MHRNEGLCTWHRASEYGKHIGLPEMVAILCKYSSQRMEELIRAAEQHDALIFMATGIQGAVDR